jgi:hypothetical protein
MPNEPIRPGTPAWRKDVKPTGRDSGARPAWRKEQPAAAISEGWWSRRTKLSLGLLGLGITITALVIVIRLLNPVKPACLVFLGDDYVLDGERKPALVTPHNAYGWKGLESLSSLKEKGVADVLGPREEFRLNSDWYKRAAEVKASTLIVFVALHGGADGQGPYLLPHEADPWDETKRFYVDKLLDQLEELVKQNPFLS